MSIARRLSRLGAALTGIGCCLFAAHAQTQMQTHVSNTATLTWRAADGDRSIASNTVGFDVPITKRPTKLSFYLPPPNYQFSGMSCQTTPTPVFTPAPIDAQTFAASTPANAVDIYSDMILVLDNQAGNHDSTKRETAVIQVDVGAAHVSLTLLETAPDSGIFAGGIPATATGKYPDLEPCDVRGARGGGTIKLSFAEDDYSYASTISILIDPAGFVFDSRTAGLVDGATVSLVDASGQPAVVYGDDGKSRYPSSVVSGQAVADASGRTYPAQTGRYRFPLVAPGTYTLKVVPPTGYTAPTIVDHATLATLKDPSGAAFILKDASYGGTLTLADTSPFFADIPIDHATTQSVVLTKLASVREASPGDFVQYHLTAVNHGTTATAASHITDTLPTGLRYERGSARGIAEPTVASDSRTLDFALPPLAPSGTADITYVVMVAPGAPVGEALNRAQIVGAGGAVSNQAMASVRLRALLFTDAMTVIGRVTEGDCGDPIDHRRGIPGVRLLLEDGTFVVTDRDGLYHFEGVRPGRHVVQIDTGSMPASHVAVACDSDTRAAGSAISRFVEGGGGLLKRVDFQLKPTGKAAAIVDAPPIAARDDGAAAGNRDWLVGQTSGIEWLFPTIDHNPRAPVVRVAIKHMPGQRIALSVNGTQVDPLSFDTTDTDEAHGLAVSKWTGIPLVPGDNRLTARVLDAKGGVVQTLERIVHVSGAPRRADYDPAHSRLVADGLTRPMIAVRVTDKDGRPATAGTMVPFTVDAPYSAAHDIALDQRRRDGQDRSVATPMQATARVVGDDGIAFITLQPTTQAGAVHAVVSMTEDKQVRTSEVRAWLAAGQKDWIVVGFGAGTIGYDMLNTHSAALPPSERNHVVADGQLAFYAKGRVKGSWLLTIAYDSKRTYDPDRGLLGTIDPDRYYTVYGDGTQQGYDAATRRKLYLRLERRQFYALFGDFETGFTETQLTRYDRTLNGVKAAYEGSHVRANGFAAHTDTLYQRDEIQGNGLSGPYRLTARGIVPNSDKMTIQTRDRYRSELILSTTTMTRHIDYDIDTDLGTIRFRAPVLSRDANGNPVFIVVDYEVESGQSAKLAAAGRVAAKFGRVELGVSGIRDETVGARTIGGIDLKAHVTRNTVLRAEAATGGIDGIGRDIAYLAEFDHHDARVDLLAYIRQQDAGFGVGQQNLVEAGTRKIGIDTRVKLTSLMTFTATLWNQQQLVGAGSRTAGEARLDYRTAQGTIFVGGQIAMDQGLDGGDRNSKLLTLGGSKTFFDNALTLTGQTQFAPGGEKDSVDFPIRHQISASWRVSPGIRLIGGYEIADGADFLTHTAQLGFDVAPWRGAKLMSTLNEQAAGENGARAYAQYGMSQSLPIGRHWTVDATVDSTATISGHINPGAQVNAFQPVASGGFTAQDQTNGSFTAVTLGAAYRAAHWSWNGRIERRVADAEDRWGLTSNFLRALGEGKTLAASVKAYTLKDKAGVTGTYAAGDVALALRPLDSRWSVLERFELRHEQAGAGLTDANLLGVPAYGAGEQVTTRVINNLAVNYRTGAEGAGHGFEATVYYGAKYVDGQFGDDVYTGFIDVIGFDLRRDIGHRFDIGVQGSVQHAWDAHAVSFSGGPSAGISPATNVWISAGYNIAGYRDRDFAEDRYTRQGPYVTMRLKFDQRTVGGAVRSVFGGGR